MMPPGLASGPPVQPPEMPTLSAIPVDGQTAAPGAGMVGALPRLFFNIEQSVETLARALPPALAAELAPVVSQLRVILVKALQSGAGMTASNVVPGETPSVTSPAGPRPESGMQFP